jgi:hypothetical protein
MGMGVRKKKNRMKTKARVKRKAGVKSMERVTKKANVKKRERMTFEEVKEEGEGNKLREGK